jgi:O-acetyl-ADP-ribose deacetylase (regulator of RNase III)
MVKGAMMIIYRVGDLLESGAEALVNAVNCAGAMGRGIALQFKTRFPENFKCYEAACRRGEARPGKMLVFEPGGLHDPKYIVNFPTKRHWRDSSRIEDIKSGLADLARVVRARSIASMAVPPLGCGLGGLSWSEVKPCIEEALSRLSDVEIHVYEPGTLHALAKRQE